MKIFLYTYESEYQKATVEETYRVRADSRDEAEHLMVHGCADLITEHKEPLGRLQSMKLIEMKEI